MNTALATPSVTTEPTAADVGELRLIALDRIHPSPMNPRKAFDPVKLKELGASIAAKGIIEPIIARPHATKGEGHVEIAAGERRWRASKLAKHLHAPVIVRQLSDAAMVEIMTIENLQRDNLQPMEEADGYALLKEKSGYDVPMIAEKIGKSTSYVHQRLKLRELAPSARAALESGKITAGHAIYIARLEPKYQGEALKSCFQAWSDQLVSTRALGEWIQRALHLETRNAPFDIKDPKLLPIAGACTTCPKRSGANPDLFGDIERDSCTDRACWGAKLTAHLDVKRAELKAKGAFVEVTTSYKTPAKGILGRHEYVEAPKGDPKAVAALVAEGEDAGKVITVRVGGPKQQAGPSSAADRKHRERMKKEKAEREREELLQRRIWAAMVPKMPKSLDAESALRLALRFAHEDPFEYAEAIGVSIPEAKADNWQAAAKAVEAHLKELRLPDLLRFLVIASLADGNEAARLAMAKKLGVNIPAIERELKAVEKAKAKAVPVAKKKPSKKAKKK